MQAEVGADLGQLCPSGDEEATKIQELYGLALGLLPSALVMALAEPLLLQPAPPAAPRIVFPARIPFWWYTRPARRWRERAHPG